MNEPRLVSLTFARGGQRIIAQLLDREAPKTCSAIWALAHRDVTLSIRHAIFTGRELGMHAPADQVASLPEFADIPPENYSVFPTPGDIMYQFCPPYQFAGDPEAVYDISICYGPDTRLFMPWGWSPSNRFARVIPQHHELLAGIGRDMVASGADDIVLRAVLGADEMTSDGDLDVRSIEPAQRHHLIFERYSALRPGQAFRLLNDHDPRSLRHHFAAEFSGAYSWTYLEEGPQQWQIQIGKLGDAGVDEVVGG